MEGNKLKTYTKKLIIADQILINNTLRKNMAVVYDSHIFSVIETNGLSHDQLKSAFKTQKIDLEIIEYQNCLLAPGFVDIHMHGIAGADIMDGTDEAFETISTELVKHGVTSFLGTTISHEKSNLLKVIDAFGAYMESPMMGARPLGIHLEGPFLNGKRAGAHSPAYLTQASKELIDPVSKIIKVITLAPEKVEAPSFIDWIKNKHSHIRLSMGHSDASYDEAIKAIESGIDSVTHLFNAMRGIHHRDPGVVGAALDTDVYSEIIADGVHVHNAAIRMAYKCKGDEKLFLVTDSMCAACMKQGKYMLGEMVVTTDGVSAKLEDGTLAGSVLTMDSAVRNMHFNVGISVDSALKMASTVPSNLLEMNDIGEIDTGKCADFVVLNEDLEVQTTIIDGEIVYRRV